jgi:hypothetical protein
VQAAEADRRRAVEAVEVGERIRRQELVVDARLGHAREAQLRVHERAAAVAHAGEYVVADPEPGRSVPVGPELRPRRARRAEGGLQHHVGVDVDHLA